jgi:hypothetical protein
MLNYACIKFVTLNHGLIVRVQATVCRETGYMLDIAKEFRLLESMQLLGASKGLVVFKILYHTYFVYGCIYIASLGLRVGVRWAEKCVLDVVLGCSMSG